MDETYIYSFVHHTENLGVITPICLEGSATEKCKYTNEPRKIRTAVTIMK